MQYHRVFRGGFPFPPLGVRSELFAPPFFSFHNCVVHPVRIWLSSSSSSSSSLSTVISTDNVASIDISKTLPSSESNSSSSNSNSSSSSSSSNSNGEYYFQQAMEAMSNLDQLRKEQEQERSEELYRAWKQAQEKSAAAAAANKNPKSQLRAEGVAVIKTIAKQARKDRHDEHASQLNSHDHHHHHHDQQQKPENYWTQQSIQFLRMAAEHGHVEAMIRLGNVSMKHAEEQLQAQPSALQQQQAQESLQEALLWYQTAGENGSAEAWFNLGHMHWVGFPAASDESNNNDNDDTTSATAGTNSNARDEVAVTSDTLLAPDRDAAMQAFSKAIALGDPDAMYFVGVHQLSLTNIDDEQQHRYGLELVEKAAQLGHGGAKYYLALFYRNGHSKLQIEPCPLSDFVKLLNDAVEARDVDALYLRGHCYYHGDDGYAQNYGKACHDFLQAAEAGHAEAAVSAGAMLHQGMHGVVQRDQRRAFELYQRAGELGSLEGWRNVAACYALGEGVPQCMESANYIIKTMLEPE